MSQPTLVASLLCEDVLPSSLIDGKPTLYRVVFDWAADRFPARVRRVFCTNFWQGGQGEFTGRVRVLTPSGLVAAEGESAFVARAGGAHAQILRFDGLILPEPGTYTIEVYRGEQMVMVYSVFVVDGSAQNRGEEN